MEDNKKEEKKVSPAKRVLAIIAVVLIIAVYIVGLVFAIMGKGYAIPVVMTSMLVGSAKRKTRKAVPVKAEEEA